MSLKKKYNHGIEHEKSSKALEKRGMSGFLISEHEGRTIVTIFGAKQKAMMAMQAAITHNEWISSMAKFVVNGPVVSVKTEAPEESNHDVNDFVPDTLEQEPATILDQPQDDDTL